MLNEGKTMNQIRDVDELINQVEGWLTSIDVRGSSQGAFARSLLTYLLSRNLISAVSRKPVEVQIISDFLVSRKGRKWLSTEEGHLARMYQNKKVSVPYIARELGRSPRAIYSKARKLRVKRPEGAMTEAKWKRQRRVG